MSAWMNASGDCPRCAAGDFEKVALSIGGKPGEAHQCRQCGWPLARRHANAVRRADESSPSTGEGRVRVGHG